MEEEEAEYCRSCRENRIFFDQGRGLYLHQGKVPAAIYRFKFKNRRSYAKVFAREMHAHYGEQLRKWGVSELIPIPLHPERRRKRGYNQAELLAEALSEETGIPAEKKALKRIRRTRPQKNLSRRERAWNLKGAFAVSGNWTPPACVLLVDDICTTGSTLNKAAKMLKGAGVRKVYFLTISIGQGL